MTTGSLLQRYDLSRVGAVFWPEQLWRKSPHDRNVRRQMAEDGRMSLGERLPVPDGDRILKRYVRPPSSFQSFLLV